MSRAARTFLWAAALAGAVACPGCLASGPIHPEAIRLNRLGAQHLRALSLGRASAAFRLSLEYDPCFADALHNLALVAWSRGRLDEAEGYERRALACRPDLVQAVNGLGAIARRRGRLDEAMGWFEAALQLDPGCLDARRNLILAARQRGDLERARDEAARLAVLAPEDPLAAPRAPGVGR